MAVKALFFDLDGTLVDTHQANYHAYKQALLDVGVAIEFEDFKRSIGHQAKTFLSWYAPGLSESDYAVIARRKALYYKEYMHLTKVNEGLVRLMAACGGMSLVLVTTAKRENALTVLRYHGLKKAFAHIITAEDVKQSKPEPDAYILALQKVSLKPQEVVAFEDSEAGRRAAEAAGIEVVMIGNFEV